MKVRDAWVRTRREMERGGIADAGIEAEVLLRHTLDLERAEFFAVLNDPVPPGKSDSVHRLTRRRIAGEPLPYLTGHREFYGLDFHVNDRVLIPRQETELLVDMAIGYARKMSRRHLSVVDVGTGCGAVGAAIAHHVDHATIVATDLSRDALLVADTNLRRHGLQRRLHLLQADLLGPVKAPIDAIVANPPYLRQDEIDGLPAEVKREPMVALLGGQDGLDIVVRLLLVAADRIGPGGCVLVEIAPDQLDAVLAMARELFAVADLSFERDSAGQPRVVRVAVPDCPGSR